MVVFKLFHFICFCPSSLLLAGPQDFRSGLWDSSFLACEAYGAFRVAWYIDIPSLVMRMCFFSALAFILSYASWDGQSFDVVSQVYCLEKNYHDTYVYL